MIHSPRVASATASLCLAFFTGVALAAPQPIDSFARRPQMQGVSLSPDGRYVSFLSGAEDDIVLMTFDRTNPGASFKRVTASEPGKFDIGWCRFANSKRLLCGVYGNLRGKRYAEPPFTRMFAVDADGTALKALELSKAMDGNLLVTRTSMRNLNMNQGAQNDKSEESMTTRTGDGAGGVIFNNAAANSLGQYRPERQDQVIDMTPGEDDTVLIQLADDPSAATIYKLNVYTGVKNVAMLKHPPIRNFVTDSRGNPRLGWGGDRGDTQYFARVEDEAEWRHLDSTQLFTDANRLRPVAMAWAANSAYAVGNYEGRDALWSIDLTDQAPPKLLFHHKLVDVGEPILRSDRSLLGVRYDVERPYVWYADEGLRALIERLERLYPGRVHEIVDGTADMSIMVLRSSSDVDAATYSLYDRDKDKLSKLGVAYPELEQKTLGTMTNILYKASDGAEVPGYLTVPTGAEKKNLPLVVMPHDGPLARDTFQFSFLRTFLANRGYAVLQMNYRGSSGFGIQWREAAKQDWGGITYSDINDATRWAVSEGIADPKRICIMGWGFGGYAALLGAVRNGDAYKCAVSINGFSDLASLQDQGIVTGDKDARRAQIGTDSAKLKANSPLENADKIDIPVLLVHGGKDWQVQEDQSKAMAKALQRAGKKVDLVLIKGANHELERKSDRATLLKEVEAFLAKNIG
ncbi:MAG TPA: prolyl oligopeptidase family serine peptidase [Steroidobacteraceae bacterium]|nr:prolyl oligopeptidase family serine peptidase [Steroidobacteraceae bacterium]